MAKDLISKIISYVDGADNGFEAAPTKWLDTGNYALNKIISGDFSKGLPFGKVVEVFGDPSTGKSLLISHLIANVQKMGGVAILDDTENAYNPFFGEKVGVDNRELIRLRSKTIEEHIEKVFIGWKDEKGKEKDSIIDLITSDVPDCPILVALDSLGRLSTRHELEKAFDVNDMTKAKNIKKGYRLATDKLQKNNLLYVMSNHVYYKIGVMFGNPKATPGGTATPFESSVRLDFTPGSKMKDEATGDVIGVETHVTVAKNRLAPPFGKTTLEIGFETGIDSYSGLLQVLERSGVVKAEGAGFYLYGEEKFRKGKFQEFLQVHKEELLK